MSSPLRIAIIGGGIAGATSYLALSRIEGVEVNVFEGARELREIGASIALQPCGLRILEKLGVGKEVEELAYRGESKASMIYRNYHTAEVLAAPPPTRLPLPHHQTARFFRPHLHQVLTSLIPSPKLHLDKRLVGIDDSMEEGVTLTFRDGSSFVCDLVVGCDGIRSAVRQHYRPSYKLELGRAITLRGVLPTALIADMPDFPIDSCHWWGPDRAFFTSPLARGIFSFVAFLPDEVLQSESTNKTYQTDSWDAHGPLEDLREFYKDWHPTIRTVCAAATDVRIYPDYHGPPLERMDLPGGRAVLLGDAGHPHGGAFAVGGSLAIEDAYALSLTLSHALSSPPSSSSLPARQLLSLALSRYSTLRSSHVQRVVHAANSVRAAKDRRNDLGLKMTEEEIRKAVRERTETEWIAENDVEVLFRELVEREGEEGLRL